MPCFRFFRVAEKKKKGASHSPFEIFFSGLIKKITKPQNDNDEPIHLGNNATPGSDGRRRRRLEQKEEACTDCGEKDEKKKEEEKPKTKKSTTQLMAGETDVEKIKSGVQQTAVLSHPTGNRDLRDKILGENRSLGIIGRGNGSILAMGLANLQKSEGCLSVPKSQHLMDLVA